MSKLKVLNWSEVTEPKAVYPEGINGAVCAALKELGDVECRLADINMPEQGLSEVYLGAGPTCSPGSATPATAMSRSGARFDRVVSLTPGSGAWASVPPHSAHHLKPFGCAHGHLLRPRWLLARRCRMPGVHHSLGCARTIPSPRA